MSSTLLTSKARDVVAKYSAYSNMDILFDDSIWTLVSLSYQAELNRTVLTNREYGNPLYGSLCLLSEQEQQSHFLGQMVIFPRYSYALDNNDIPVTNIALSLYLTIRFKLPNAPNTVDIISSNVSAYVINFAVRPSVNPVIPGSPASILQCPAHLFQIPESEGYIYLRLKLPRPTAYEAYDTVPINISIHYRGS